MEINFTNSAFVIYPVHCLLVFITNYFAISDVSTKWVSGCLLLLCCHLVYPIVSIAISNDLAANRIFSHDIICIAVFITHLLCKLVT